MFIKEVMTKLIVSQIEKYMGKYTKKCNVAVQDDGEAGFTVTIRVFESLSTVMTNATKTLSGLLKKKE